MENYLQYQQRILASGVFTNTVSQSEPSLLLHLFHWFAQYTGLSLLWQNTFYGLKAQILLLQRQEQPLEALNLLLNKLGNSHFWVAHEAKWWSLMRSAVGIAQDLHCVGKSNVPMLRLMKLCQQAPQPWQGYDCAYCFAIISLWSFEQNKCKRAIEQVHIAMHADPSWGYPEYLFGWYGLFWEGIDTVHHFVKAIQIDRTYLQRVQQDPFLNKQKKVYRAVLNRIRCN